MREGATRTALFGIFVVTRRKLTASQVIALAQPMGFSPANIKSHLTRMVAEGALHRSGPVRLARYWPSEKQTVVVHGITARLQNSNAERWDGGWIMMALRFPARRSAKDKLKAALWFDGFRPWTNDTWIRPAWPKRWAMERANTYLEQSPGLCLRGWLLKPMSMAQIARAYQLDALDREALKLALWIRQSAVPRLPAQAFAERLRIGGMVARLVGHDPWLPAALCGRRIGMRKLLGEFHRFEARIAPLAQRFLDAIFASGASS